MLECLNIVTKQLTNESLSPEDHKFFKELPSMLDSVVPKTRSQSLSVGLVADVHTHTVEAKVVEEAVGKVDLIIVACPMPEGKAFLAVGPVFSYYEFKHPMSDRLTDEAWRKLLDSPNKPERPRWYVPLMRLSNNSSTNAENADERGVLGSPKKPPRPRRDIPLTRHIADSAVNTDRKNLKKLTNAKSLGYHAYPSWSPDGKKIAFDLNRGGNYEIYIMNADGSEQKNFSDNPAIDARPCWSPCGTRIAFHSTRAGQF